MDTPHRCTSDLQRHAEREKLHKIRDQSVVLAAQLEVDPSDIKCLRLQLLKFKNYCLKMIALIESNLIYELQMQISIIPFLNLALQ